MKNIWIFNHYATKPDEPTTREYDIGKELVKKGHQVSVFASSFSHYKFQEKYLSKKEKYRQEIVDGVRFFWIKTFPYNKNDWRRALNMLSYSWRVFWLGLRLKNKPDIIIGTCVHPLAALSAYLVAKIKKSRFFFEVTDLWPQMLIDMDLISKSNPLVFILRILEKFLFKKAEKIIILLPHSDNYITKLGIPKEKIFWIPNGADLSLYEHIKEYDGTRDNNFIFMYAGIHSPYANLDAVLKAAEILQKRGKTNMKFVLVGDGTEKANLIKMAGVLKLNNVEFWDMVPKSEVCNVLEKADAFILIIKDIVSEYGVGSNKLNDYFASGRPIIFSVNSKSNPVADAGAGISCQPDNPEALAGAVEEIMALTPEERIKMGQNGRDYAKKNIDIKILAEKLEKLF